MTKNHDAWSKPAIRSPQSPPRPAQTAGQETVAHRLGKEWSSHLTLIASAFIVLWVVVRLLATAGFDANTATSILQESGTATVIVGTVLSATTIAIPLIIAVGLGLLAYRLTYHRSLPHWIYIPASFLGAMWLVIASPVFGLFFLALTVSVGVVFAMSDRKTVEPKRSKDYSVSIRVFWGILATFGTIGLILSTQPWMPTETIKTASGETIYGYVLRSSDQRWAILRDHPREVIFIESNKVRQRALCRVERPWFF